MKRKIACFVVYSVLLFVICYGFMEVYNIYNEKEDRPVYYVIDVLDVRKFGRTEYVYYKVRLYEHLYIRVDAGSGNIRFEHCDDCDYCRDRGVRSADGKKLSFTIDDGLTIELKDKREKLRHR